VIHSALKVYEVACIGKGNSLLSEGAALKDSVGADGHWPAPSFVAGNIGGGNSAYASGRHGILPQDGRDNRRRGLADE